MTIRRKSGSKTTRRQREGHTSRAGGRVGLIKKRPVTARDRQALRETEHTNRFGMTKGRARKWNPQKLVDYVCERMEGGETVTDILRSIHVAPNTFYTIVEYDVDDKSQLSVQYRRARRKQAAAYSDAARKISEGNDPLSQRHNKKIQRIHDRLVRRALRKGTISPTFAKQLLREAKSTVRELDRNLIARNKLQMEAARWLASVTDRETYGPKADHSFSASPDGGANLVPTLTVRFIAPEPTKSTGSKKGESHGD